MGTVAFRFQFAEADLIAMSLYECQRGREIDDNGALPVPFAH